MHSSCRNKTHRDAGRRNKVASAASLLDMTVETPFLSGINAGMQVEMPFLSGINAGMPVETPFLSGINAAMPVDMPLFENVLLNPEAS